MNERAAAVAGLELKARQHMLRHACGFALANKGHDTRAIYGWLSRWSITSTPAYKALAPNRVQGLQGDCKSARLLTREQLGAGPVRLVLRFPISLGDPLDDWLGRLALGCHSMKTYVAEIDGEAILAFRAEDDAAAEAIIREKNGGFQLVIRGYSGLVRADGRALWDGTSPIGFRLASPSEHEQWSILHHTQSGGADNPDDWVVYLVPVASIDERDNP